MNNQTIIQLVPEDFFDSYLDQDPDRIEVALEALHGIEVSQISFSDLESSTINLAAAYLHAGIDNLWNAYRAYTAEPYECVPTYLDIEGALASDVETLILDILNFKLTGGQGNG